LPTEKNGAVTGKATIVRQINQSASDTGQANQTFTRTKNEKEGVDEELSELRKADGDGIRGRRVSLLEKLFHLAKKRPEFRPKERSEMNQWIIAKSRQGGICDNLTHSLPLARLKKRKNPNGRLEIFFGGLRRSNIQPLHRWCKMLKNWCDRIDISHFSGKWWDLTKNKSSLN
jgi:hypothetical protein